MSEEVFEITDFTTASDWERFIAAFEEIISHWSRADGQQRSTECLRFGKTEFGLQFHSSAEMGEKGEDEPWMRSSGDFPVRSHCLERWFGVQSFFVLQPIRDQIQTEDRIRLLLSALSIGLANTACALPVFVQLSHPSRRLFAGVAVSSGQSRRTLFQTIQLERSPRALNHLSALLDVFREQLGVSHVTADLAIRVTYAVRHWPSECLLPSIDTPDPLWPLAGLLRRRSDPLMELQISCLWPSVSEEVVVDSHVHSDLTPDNAQTFVLRALFTEDAPLSLAVQAFLALQSERSDSEENWSESQVSRELERVFSEEDSRQEKSREDVFREKSAPEASLSSRIACFLFNAFLTARSQHSSLVLTLWSRVVCRLRDCWERRVLLPHVSHTDVDLRACLLEQKLRLLLTCIRESRDRREDSSSDEEFFDCSEEDREEAREDRPEGRLAPCGQLRLLLRPAERLFVPKTLPTVPMTEDMLSEQMHVLSQLGTTREAANLRARMQSASLRSDMSAFKAANLGSIFDDFVRWHSPRDFTESQDSTPDRPSGVLSARFQSGVWRDVWDSAPPVPARRQRALFEVETEAQKVIHFLQSLTVEEIARLLAPILVDSLCRQMALNARNSALPSEPEFNGHDLQTSLQTATTTERNVLRALSLQRKLRSSDDVMKSERTDETVNRMVGRLVFEPELEISAFGTEAEIARKILRVTSELVYESEVSVGERDMTSRPKPLEPMAREFIIRARAKRPEPFSAESGQRMYCLLSSKEFRICGAFAECLK